jgi:hypothetical protein
VYHLDGDMLNDEPENLCCASRKILRTRYRYENALSLLEKREEKIMKQLPKLNYDTQRDLIRELHTTLNRIRKLQSKIKQRIKL